MEFEDSGLFTARPGKCSWSISRWLKFRRQGREQSFRQDERQRLETERTLQLAAEREQQEAEERQRLETQKAEQLAAERQRQQAERARQAALLAEQRKREQYWQSLGGIEFERELGRLYRARDYQVEFTPVSGDEGVDLILRKDGKTTVVQCKAQKRPASPTVIRDLYGSMLHHRADSAILACTGGFSDNVIRFARGKPIELISSWHIARMAEESGEGMLDLVEISPVCPIDGCGRTMVVRAGRFGRFWGCPGYPTCQGRRAFRSRI